MSVLSRTLASPDGNKEEATTEYSVILYAPAQLTCAPPVSDLLCHVDVGLEIRTVGVAQLIVYVD